jgi:hypothetical protein
MYSYQPTCNLRGPSCMSYANGSMKNWCVALMLPINAPLKLFLDTTIHSSISIE